MSDERQSARPAVYRDEPKRDPLSVHSGSAELTAVTRQVAVAEGRLWESCSRTCNKIRRMLHDAPPTDHVQVFQLRLLVQETDAGVDMLRGASERLEMVAKWVGAAGALVLLVSMIFKLVPVQVVGGLLVLLGAVGTALAKRRLSELARWAETVERGRKALWDPALQRAVDESERHAHDARDQVAEAKKYMDRVEEQQQRTEAMLAQLTKDAK